MALPAGQGFLGQHGVQSFTADRGFSFIEESADALDPVEAYFECITTCSLDDGECITSCTEVLRQQGS